MAAKGSDPADDILAGHLAAGRSVVEAASAAGVSERTAHRRLKLPAFTARVAELRGQMVSAAAGKLADGMTRAADVLSRLLGSEDENVRARAAALILTHGIKVAELVEIEKRVAALEQSAAQGDAT